MPRKLSTKASPQGKHKRNWANRTVFQCDGLKALRGMNTGTVDLIVGEIPRFKAAGFYEAQEKIQDEASFQDRWAAEEGSHQTCMEEIQGKLPAAWQAIDAAQAIHGPGMGAFMCFMGLRLIEMHRVLRSTGSIYLHCDHAVSHYLKLLMDAIFGTKHFKNEIAWCYRGVGGKSNKAFLERHDVLLFYTKSKDATFHQLYTPYSAEQRHKMQKRKGDLSKINQMLERGAPMLDWWDDIPPMLTAARGKSPFRLQPIALYARAISASSKQSDVVTRSFLHSSINSNGSRKPGASMGRNQLDEPGRY